MSQLKPWIFYLKKDNDGVFFGAKSFITFRFVSRFFVPGDEKQILVDGDTYYSSVVRLVVINHLKY